MKKLFSLVLIALASTVLFSSCSHLPNLTVSKRHYRGGYYVDLSSPKKETAPPKSSEPVALMKSKPGSVAVNTGGAVQERIAEKPSSLNLLLPAEHKKEPKKHTASNLYAATQSASVVKEEAKAERLNENLASMPEASAPGKSSSGTPMWVIILFAILIPPLGVFLKFNTINDKFWISLLLTLLFWLPGAIYSVIIVTQKK